MDKNVGGVDLEELMRAREELDRERGVETDPDMYNDYGKDHSEPVVSEERPEEVVQEEPQGYNYNQETNEAYSNDGRTVDGDGDGYAVRPGDNEYGWVAEEDTPEVKQEEPQSFADAFENERETSSYEESVNSEPSYEEPAPVQEEPAEPAQTAEPEPKDLNMYDIFAEFEVKENANISSVIDVNAVASESADKEEESEETPVVMENAMEVAPEPSVPETSEPEVKEEGPSGIDDLVSEILAGYDLDAEDDEPETPEEKNEEQSSVIDIDVDGVHADAVQAGEVLVEKETTEETDAMEAEPARTEEAEEVEKYIGETVANHELIGGEHNEIIDEHNDAHINKDDGVIDDPEKLMEAINAAQTNDSVKNYFEDEENEEEKEESTDVENTAEAETEEVKAKTEETENEAEQNTEEVVEEKDSVSLIQELQSEIFAQKVEPTTAPPTEAEPEAKQDVQESGETEVITDYSKLKDILQQELEEAERAEIQKIEEVKAETVKPQKQYGDIEPFNFVDEIVNEEFKESDKLSYLIGKDEEGKCVYGNFKEQYNLVIFGKEKIYTDNLVNSILLSLSLKNEVNDTNFIILDADINSTYEIYNKSSYIFFNRIAKTNKEILDTLIEVSKELDDRYNKLAGFGVKDIDQYNLSAIEAGVPKMPYLVVVFNNYTKSSQATDNDKIIACLHRVLKYGRITGIYAVVVATNPIEQDEINYNLPSRIALKNEDDSIYTIGETGASSLTEDNDLLYSNIMAEKVVHLKLPNISETERELLITGLEE